MKFLSQFTVYFIVLYGLADVTMSEKTHDHLHDVAQRANKFGVELFQTLNKDRIILRSKDNVLISPISAELALAQIFLGAGGNTAAEMRKVLNFHEEKPKFLNDHKHLTEALQGEVIKTANKLYVAKTFPVKKEFQNKVTNYFLSTIEQADFSGDSENVRKAINQWVEKQTNNKIKDLLKKGVVNSDAKLVVVNALHFKDDWKKKFESHETYEERFYHTPTETVPVDMMHLVSTFGYRHNPQTGTQVLELPYKNGETRMLIILPGAKDGLDLLVETLSSVNLHDEHDKLKPTLVSVTLPKFKIETEIELNDKLQKLGINDLFIASHANLTGISEKSNLVVSTVVQKAFIEVNEKGTEAAAATGAVAVLTSLPYYPVKPEVFRADHPFIFLLCHKNIVLFAGAFKKP